MILHKPMEIVPDCWDDGTGVMSKCAYNDYPTPVDGLVLEPTDHVPVLVTTTTTDSTTGEITTTVTDTVTGSSITNITDPATAATTTVVKDDAGATTVTDTTPTTPASCDYPWWLLAVGFGLGYIMKKSKK